MAAVAIAQLDKKEHDELCCIYSALLLHDDNQDISGENIKKVIAASQNEVDSYWPGSFARALKGRNVGDLIANVGAAAPAAAPAAAAADTKEGEAEPEKKVEDEPEDVEMGNLFGDDDEDDY